MKPKIDRSTWRRFRRSLEPDFDLDTNFLDDTTKPKPAFDLVTKFWTSDDFDAFDPSKHDFDLVSIFLTPLRNLTLTW